MRKCPSSFPVCWFSWPKVTFLRLRFTPKLPGTSQVNKAASPTTHTSTDQGRRRPAGFQHNVSIKDINRQRPLKQRALPEESAERITARRRLFHVCSEHCQADDSAERNTHLLAVHSFCSLAKNSFSSFRFSFWMENASSGRCKECKGRKPSGKHQARTNSHFHKRERFHFYTT